MHVPVLIITHPQPKYAPQELDNITYTQPPSFTYKHAYPIFYYSLLYLGLSVYIRDHIESFRWPDIDVCVMTNSENRTESKVDIFIS